MTAESLLAQLKRRGISLAASGGRLQVEAPKRALTTTLRTELAQHKAELLALLREEASDRQAPSATDEEARQEAAAAFVGRAGARLVCPQCWVDCPPGEHFAILVPAANDDPEFRRALIVLRLDGLPVIPRSQPLDSLQATPGCRVCRAVAVTE